MINRRNRRGWAAQKEKQKDGPRIPKIPDSIRNSPFYHSVALRGVPGVGCPRDLRRTLQISEIDFANRLSNERDRQLFRTPTERKLRTRDRWVGPRSFPPPGVSLKCRRTVKLERAGSAMATSRKTPFSKDPGSAKSPRDGSFR